RFWPRISAWIGVAGVAFARCLRYSHGSSPRRTCVSNVAPPKASMAVKPTPSIIAAIGTISSPVSAPLSSDWLPSRNVVSRRRGPAGRGDDDLQSALARARRPLHDAPWIAVRGADLDLVFNPQLVKDFDARLHERQVGFGAEDDADDWTQTTASRAMSVRKKAP